MFFEITVLGGLLAAIVAIAVVEKFLTRSGSPQRLGTSQVVGCDFSLRPEERVWAWQDREFLRATVVDFDDGSADTSSTGPRAPMCRVSFEHAPTDVVELPASMVRKDSEEPPEMVPANEWHSIRRRMILSSYPEIRKLTAVPAVTYTVLMTVLVLLHLGVGVWIATYAQGGAVWFWAILLAATVGAFCAYGFQQLTHEISHTKRTRAQKALVLLTDLMVGTTGPNYTDYYFKFHMHHHANTSKPSDPDLYYHSEWADPPPWAARSRLGRFFWITVFGLFTFEVLLLGHLFGRAPRPRMTFRNKELILTLLGKYGFMALTFWFGGFWCFVYFKLAAGFSLGAFAHPYSGFWLMQHAAMVRNGFQPTLSYSGSRIWHWLNFGELYHVEHHDFPWVPFTKIEAVRRIAPEYFDTLHVIPSVWRLNWEWLSHTDGTPWSDVAGAIVYPAPEFRADIRRRPTPEITAPMEMQSGSPGLSSA